MTTAETFPEELAARYQPVRPLGEGAMGVVWLATDKESGLPVAVKVMSRLDDPHLVQRTLRECQLLADLDHPAVLRYLDSGRLSTGPFLVTEFLEGRSLEEAGVGTVDAEPVMMQIAEGLDAVHRRGLLHRDVKPANLFLTRDGRAVLLDFGLALDAERTRLTATSSNLLGTPAFLAPEVWGGRQASPASDWYAWGLSAHYLLEGHLPMEPQEVLDWVVSGGEWKDPRLERSDPDLPFSRGVRACLAPDPEQRVQSLADLRAAMRVAGKPAGPASKSRPSDAVTTHPMGGIASGLGSGPYQRPGTSRGSLLVRVGASLVVVAALAWGLLPGPRPEGPAPVPEVVTGAAAPTTPTPTSGDRFHLGHVSKLERELLEARRYAITRTGRRISVERMAQEDRLALSSDPVHHRAGLEGLPELWRLLVWISQGGDIRSLPRELQEELRDLDGAYQAELGEPVLDAYLAAAPATDPAPFLSDSWIRKQVLLPVGSPLQGPWTKAALRAFQEAYRLRAEYDEELTRNPRGPIRGGEVVAVGGLVGVTDIDDYLVAVAIRPATRTQARDWVLPGIVQFRRALVLARRALEEDEPLEELVGCIFAETAGAMGGFFVAGHSTLPPAMRDGGPATRPATWFLRGEVVRKAAGRLDAFNADSRAHWEALPEIWLRAMAPSPDPEADPRWVAWRRGRSFWRLIRQAYKERDSDLVRRAVLVALPWLHTVDERSLARGGNELVRFLLLHPEGIGLTTEQRVRLLEVLGEVEGGPEFHQRRDELRRRWGR